MPVLGRVPVAGSPFVVVPPPRLAKLSVNACVCSCSGSASLARGALQERVFYESRFGLLQSSEDAPELMHRVKLSFLEGLHWCLLTAAGACPSWTWQSPFHFAPRTQDMTALK